jgi:D-cysteine desulfhydrase
MHGLVCVAAVMGLPFLSETERPSQPGIGDRNGNVLLDEMLGVDLRIFKDGTWDELFEHSRNVAEELHASGKRVYEVPVGGSSALGAFAFVQAGLELREQSPEFDWLVFASSSGSTQTGLAYAFHGTRTAVQGIACDPEPDLVDDFRVLYGELEGLVGERRPLAKQEWNLSLDFVGPGYGVPSDLGNAAIRMLAQKEGIFLDPVYTGKAFSGLLELARAGEIRGRVVFWHTGGVPALFAGS